MVSKVHTQVGNWLLTLGLVVVILTTAISAMAAGVEPRRNNTVASPVRAHVLAVIDGDTLAVSVRIWIGQTIETRVRLAGVDTPELRGDCDQERELAAADRDFVTVRVGGGTSSCGMLAMTSSAAGCWPGSKPAPALTSGP